MARLVETVLYYTPDGPESGRHTALLKSVLVRMGIRIRNVRPDQALETVGYLAGLPGFLAAGDTEEEIPVIPSEMMVFRNFSSGRLDQLLLNLRRAGVPKISLKAVLTEHNSKWTFYKLYEELKEEHRKAEENA